MKHTVILIFIALWILGCNVEAKRNNDLAKSNLKGSVKMLKESYYATFNRFGESQKSELKSVIIFKFNKEGYLFEKTEFGSNGEIEQNDSYSYNDSIMHRNTTIYYNGTNVYSKRYTKYINNIQRYFEDIGENGILYEIDSNIIYNQNGKLDESLEYQKFVPNKPNNFGEYSNINYTPSRKVKYAYDKTGNMIEANIWTAGKYSWREPVTTKYKYDNFNNIIESDYSGANYITLYKYDKDQNEIEETTTIRSSGKVKTEKYIYNKYDEKKNWLARTETDEEGKVFVTEREFDYY